MIFALARGVRTGQYKPAYGARLHEVGGWATMATEHPTDQTDLPLRIEAAKRELERMIDLVPQGMFLVDTDGMIQRANAGLLRLLGLSRYGEVLGRDVREVFGFVRGLEAAEGLLVSGEGGGESPDAVRECEEDVAMPERGVRRLRFTIVSAGVGGNVSVAMVDDVTEYRAQAESREKNTKIQTTEAIVGALLHTVNQPLTVIMASAHLILHDARRQPGDLAGIAANAERIMDMVGQIADVLKRAHRLRDFVVQPYPGNTSILDIDRSAEPPAPAP